MDVAWLRAMTLSHVAALTLCVLSLQGCETREQGNTPLEESEVPGLESEVLLGGSVRARLTEAPPNADPDRIWELVDPLGDLPPGTLINDAVRVGEGWAVIQWSHELWYMGPEGSRELDQHANAPLAVRGTMLTYARGQAPDLEVVRVDTRGGSPEQLTQDFAPVWNPALGPHGEVVFVSGRDGGPALYRVRAGHAPVRLVDEGHFPSSLVPPEIEDGHLVFLDESSTRFSLPITDAAQVGSGSIEPAEGSVEPAEGSVEPAEGSVEPAEVSLP